MAGITELWKDERLGSLILINVVPGISVVGGGKVGPFLIHVVPGISVVGGGKDGPFLINVVAGITELWVENSQKMNCRDVTSIREGRVSIYISIYEENIDVNE